MDLTRLHPAFRGVAEAVVANAARAGVPVLVVQTFRDPAEQARLWAQGRTQQPDGSWRVTGRVVTNAPAGRSPHEYGLAIDVVPCALVRLPGWAPNSELWGKLGEVVRASGGEWGGDWTRFKDRPHVQLPGWKLLAFGRGGPAGEA